MDVQAFSKANTSIPTVLFWSGGKDSAMAFDALETSLGRGFRVTTLLTTVDEQGLVGVHGVPVALIEQQAAALGCALRTVEVPQGASNAVYEAQMLAALGALREQGVAAAAAGDLFLKDLRSYRQRLVSAAGLKAVFPLWQRDPWELAGAFIGGGFSALTVCVDALALPKSFVGRAFDRAFLAELPPEVDPCGENGEFHTFVSAGPHFKRPVVYRQGKVGRRRERYSADVASNFYTCELFAC